MVVNSLLNAFKKPSTTAFRRQEALEKAASNCRVFSS